MSDATAIPAIATPPGWQGILDEGEQILWQGQRAGLVRLRLGVDQAGVLEMRDHAIISEAFAPRSARRFRASKSIAAMRTATPIST